LLGEMGADNPSSIPRKEIEAWVKEGVVNYLGKTNDVHQYLLKADCIVLPSYREGTPRSLLEAAATAKPVITTDTPGCRNVVDDRVTGYLCKAKDATDLAEKMQSIIQMSEQERLEFGRLARQKMEIQFDEKTVIEKYFSALQDVPPGGYKIRSKLIKYMTS
ncbi:MAG TPA: glycosyltransferase, partial [Gammaproteobacteria bacterium]|nr:glycosyltransferase [Gammaproteobacteria bacterium]